MSGPVLFILLVLFGLLVLVLLRRWRRQTSGTAALPPPGQTRPSGPLEKDNVDDRLTELEQLLEQGQITRTEYDRRRRDLLNSVRD